MTAWPMRSPASFSQTVNPDRKSTRLNSSHLGISYAVFCLKKKNAEHYAGHRGELGSFAQSRARLASQAPYRIRIRVCAIVHVDGRGEVYHACKLLVLCEYAV